MVPLPHLDSLSPLPFSSHLGEPLVCYAHANNESVATLLGSTLVLARQLDVFSTRVPPSFYKTCCGRHARLWAAGAVGFLLVLNVVEACRDVALSSR